MVYGEEIEVDRITTPLQFISDFISTKLRKIKKMANKVHELWAEDKALFERYFISKKVIQEGRSDIIQVQ